MNFTFRPGLFALGAILFQLAGLTDLPAATSLVPPGNDNFADRFSLPGSSLVVTSSSANASIELDEPLHAGNDGGSSVWWSWTAPFSGQIEVTTVGSSFDTLLAVYEGSALETLQLIAANDDDPAGGTRSRLGMRVSAGITYAIAVDGYDGAAGVVVLRLGAIGTPSNDDFVAATPVNSAPYSVITSNAGATREENEPSHAGNPGGRSLWWVWIPPYSGQAEVTTFGSAIDTVLAIYTGDAVSNLTQVASNDDDPNGGLTSRLVTSVTAGIPHYIAVDGFDGASGGLTLGIQLTSRHLGMLRPGIIAGKRRLEWADASGTLQTAPTPSGPWTNLSGQRSPYELTNSAPQQFFRLFNVLE